MSVMRFVILGAVWFGIGWALLGVVGDGFAIVGGVGTLVFGAIFSGDYLALLVYALVFGLGGAFGGAVLGLGLRDGRKAAIDLLSRAPILEPEARTMLDQLLMVMVSLYLLQEQFAL